LIKTTGKRKGYKVMGMINYFTGRLFFQGSTERLTAKRYCDFLATILAATRQPIIVIQDGARYHTAAETQTFIAQHAARLTVHQLPSYSPHYNPIEHLWRNVKRAKTHNRYFLCQASTCCTLAVVRRGEAAPHHSQFFAGAAAPPPPCRVYLPRTIIAIFPASRR